MIDTDTLNRDPARLGGTQLAGLLGLGQNRPTRKTRRHEGRKFRPASEPSQRLSGDQRCSRVTASTLRESNTLIRCCAKTAVGRKGYELDPDANKTVDEFIGQFQHLAHGADGNGGTRATMQDIEGELPYTRLEGLEHELKGVRSSVSHSGSLHVKTDTHDAYEHQNNPTLSPDEQAAWKIFQQNYFGLIPEPPGVQDIPNYP